MGLALLFYHPGQSTSDANDDNVVNTQLKEEEQKDENFENPDQGFDADLEAATESTREDTQNVEAPAKEDEPIGAMNQENETSMQTLNPVLGAEDKMMGMTGPSGDEGSMKGENGGGSGIVAPGMRGRSGATKDRLLKAGGGNSASEAAVARGLHWLVRQQKTDGHWQFDGANSGGTSKDDVAATAMCILPFLAAGETHKSGKVKEYMLAVKKGLTWLASMEKSNGDFAGKKITMYTRAVAACTLCEAYGMTKDYALRNHAQAAINFIVNAQAKDGSWGYEPNKDGDTSIVGWQIQALRSAKVAGLVSPKSAMDKARSFLVSVSQNEESRYGYRAKGGSYALSAVGLLCRQYMGWGPKNPSLAKGVEYLKTLPPQQANFDIYYYYYATQVMHFFGGSSWDTFWNPMMRDLLIKQQEKGAGPNNGRWPKDDHLFGQSTGALGQTCLSLLTLEVYYRHLPLYKREGSNALDDAGL